MDWADKLADEALNGKGRIIYGQELKDRIAAYLRKAKVDGMREAAELTHFRKYDGLSDYEAIRALADKIEHGEPTEQPLPHNPNQCYESS